ncbi:MAG TPA: RNase H family protein [Terriglobales bacterium]|nr:RNase H family protein [Terriglobales bacterium]
MIDDPHALKIYIDGNSYKNPGGPGGFAGIAVYPDDWNRDPEIIFQLGFQQTTNNRMELSACIRAYEYVREHGPALGVQRVQIVTDSQYVNDNLRYARFWKANRWKTRSGRPVDNEDLWKELLSLQSKVKVRTEVIWRKGKKSPLLKAIDRAAKDAGKQPWKIDRGFREGKVGRSKLPGAGASQLFPATGQDAIVHVYRSGLVGRSGFRVFFDLYSEAAAGYIGKYRAYCPPEIAADLHRGHTYRVRFNNGLNHPQIEAILERDYVLRSAVGA